MNQTVQSSTGLVLRKLDYSETSLIFVLLTQEHGKQSFLFKGARKTGKKKFPAVDLFRHVRVTYRHRPNADLMLARDAELLANFDRLASIPNHFRTAIWICRFIERNTADEDPVPQLFEALRCAFLRLNGPKLATCTPVWLGLAFSMLDEHGLLPDLSEWPEQENAMQYMLAYANDHELPAPEYDDDVWLDLAEWTMDFLDTVELKLPDGVEQIE